MTNTPNKFYPLQVTGTNVGTWGTVVNTNVLSVLDNNLGGTLVIDVSGNSNINLTSAQASYLIHDLAGVLTGNIDYIFPIAGGIYAINNGTTGAFTVTVQMVGGSGSVVVLQGVTTIIVVDAAGLNVLSASAGVVNLGVAGQLAYYASSGTAVSGDPSATIVGGALTLGVATSVQGSLVLSGSTSGTTTLSAPSVGTGTMSLQAGTDTLVGRATTDTLTDKTYDTAWTGNVFKINGTSITAISGNTGTVGTTTGSFTSGHLAKFDASGNIIDDGLAIAALSGNTTTVATTSGSFTSGHIATFDASSNIVDGGAVPTNIVTALGVGSIILAYQAATTWAAGATFSGGTLTSCAGNTAATGDTLAGIWQALQRGTGFTVESQPYQRIS